MRQLANDVPSGVLPCSALQEALGAGEPRVRREAAAALGQMGSSAVAAVPALAAALKDADVKVRLSAATALGAIGPPATSAIPALIVALQGSHLILGRLAAQALSRIGLAAVPKLTEALGHPDAFIRREAAWALGEIGPALAAGCGPIDVPPAPGPLEQTVPLPQEVPTVRVKLTREELDRNVQVAALPPGPPHENPVLALTAALKDEDPRVRAAAVQALNRIKSERGT